MFVDIVDIADQGHQDGAHEEHQDSANKEHHHSVDEKHQNRADEEHQDISDEHQGPSVLEVAYSVRLPTGETRLAIKKKQLERKTGWQNSPGSTTTSSSTNNH